VKRFGGGILPDVLLELASCERRADFSRPAARGSRLGRLSRLAIPFAVIGSIRLATAVRSGAHDLGRGHQV
jgi:hypothetical protein